MAPAAASGANDGEAALKRKLDAVLAAVALSAVTAELLAPAHEVPGLNVGEAGESLKVAAAAAVAAKATDEGEGADASAAGGV